MPFLFNTFLSRSLGSPHFSRSSSFLLYSGCAVGDSIVNQDDKKRVWAQSCNFDMYSIHYKMRVKPKIHTPICMYNLQILLTSTIDANLSPSGGVSLSNFNDQKRSWTVIWHRYVINMEVCMMSPGSNVPEIHMVHKKS